MAGQRILDPFIGVRVPARQQIKNIKRCYTLNIYTKFSTDELMTLFLEKGGKINKHYLQEWHKNKRTVVYLNGWFSGKNVKEALIKALV